MMTRYYLARHDERFIFSEEHADNSDGRRDEFYAQVAVIDFADDEVAEGLLTVLATSGAFTGLTQGAVSKLQAAFREFANPKPPEPTGLGAVVEDNKGVRWLRTEKSPALPWDAVGSSPHRWTCYSHINAVEVLSEGLED